MFYIMYHMYGQLNVIEKNSEEEVEEYILEHMCNNSGYELENYKIIYGREIKPIAKEKVTSIKFEDVE